jgi:hypothetical protein
MPRFGTLDVSELAGTVPEIDGYAAEPLTLKNAQLLNVTGEISAIGSDALLPPAMNPSIPPYVQCTVMVIGDSPWGPFSTGELRLVGRAGYRPRARTFKTYIDNPKAAAELARHWGFPTVPGKAQLHPRHERIVVEIDDDKGHRVLDAEMVDREGISGSDIQYVASMHLARNRADGRLVLVQVDPDYTFTKVDRGFSHFINIDQTAWGSKGLVKVTNPIISTYAQCDVILPKVRFVCDPNRNALESTVRVAS